MVSYTHYGSVVLMRFSLEIWSKCMISSAMYTNGIATGTLQVVQGFMLHPSANLTASITSMQELEVKLAKNNAIDTLSKGKPSLGVKFTCPSN